MVGVLYLDLTDRLDFHDMQIENRSFDSMHEAKDRWIGTYNEYFPWQRRCLFAGCLPAFPLDSALGGAGLLLVPRRQSVLRRQRLCKQVRNSRERWLWVCVLHPDVERHDAPLADRDIIKLTGRCGSGVISENISYQSQLAREIGHSHLQDVKSVMEYTGTGSFVLQPTELCQLPHIKYVLNPTQPPSSLLPPVLQRQPAPVCLLYLVFRHILYAPPSCQDSIPPCAHASS